VVRIAFLSAVCTVALAVPGIAQAQLVATVTDSATISLTKDGAPVTHLDPGTYTIEVHDLTEGHNFHLTGPGVDEMTPISSEEETSWEVTFGHGPYHFQCDVHPGSMFGDFTVGNVLEVDKTGTGQGTVTSNPAGISCGAVCAAGFPSGGTVTLTAVAAGGSSFSGWSGACSGTDPCEVNVSGAKKVTATFTSSGGPGPPPATGPPGKITSVKAAKKKGVRTITVMLNASRSLTAAVKVARKGKKVVAATRSFKTGHRTLKLKIPKKTKKGKVTVTILLKSPTGSPKSVKVTRTVKLPK
jgi:plastocyanin